MSKPRIATARFVYFIEDGVHNAIKIGCSAHHPRARLRDLQVGHPGELRLLAFIAGGRETESGLHERFGTLRIRGEWFQHEGALREYTRGLAPADESTRMGARVHLFRRKRSCVWQCWYYLPNGVRIRRSTKCVDEEAALAVLRRYEREAQGIE